MLIHPSPLHFSIPQSRGQWTRVVSRGKKVRFHYSLCARRNGTAVVDRFRASYEMIKHYDRFIGGHDSTVNHRRKQATREATRDPLTTRCHSRTLGRLSMPRSPSVWKLYFFPTFLQTREKIFARASKSTRFHTTASSHAFRQSGNCWTDRSISDEVILNVTTWPRNKTDSRYRAYLARYV